MEGGTGSQASGFFTVINEGGSHIQIQTYIVGVCTSQQPKLTYQPQSQDTRARQDIEPATLTGSIGIA